MPSVEVEVVYMEQVCSSCYIKLPYIRDMLNKLTTRLAGVQWSEKHLTTKEEFEQFRQQTDLTIFPVIMIDGKQFSAGIIPRPDELESAIKERLVREL